MLLCFVSCAWLDCHVHNATGVTPSQWREWVDTTHPGLSVPLRPKMKQASAWVIFYPTSSSKANRLYRSYSRSGMSVGITSSSYIRYSSSILRRLRFSLPVSAYSRKEVKAAVCCLVGVVMWFILQLRWLIEQLKLYN